MEDGRDGHYHLCCVGRAQGDDLGALAEGGRQRAFELALALAPRTGFLYNGVYLEDEFLASARPAKAQKEISGTGSGRYLSINTSTTYEKIIIFIHPDNESNCAERGIIVVWSRENNDRAKFLLGRGLLLLARCKERIEIEEQPLDGRPSIVHFLFYIAADRKFASPTAKRSARMGRGKRG
jgi:hypothetical protein